MKKIEAALLDYVPDIGRVESRLLKAIEPVSEPVQEKIIAIPVVPVVGTKQPETLPVVEKAAPIEPQEDGEVIEELE
jgi:hypothetical protein